MPTSTWHKDQIRKYRTEYEIYKTYADVLSKILEAASHLHAPLAIVQARPKSVSSFAEKAIRKHDKYKEPYRQLTDLCGGRIITHTQDQVDNICRFIQDNFEVDWANSLDVSSRLSTSEFGYLSHHYVVQLKSDSVLGVETEWKMIENRKAEIQVRTLLQHAWADILHDRIYKSGFKVPEASMRDSARLAALLESTDREFAQFTNNFDRYKLNYSAYMKADERLSEIDALRLILANEPKSENKPAIAMQIAFIAKTCHDWQLVCEVLEPYSKTSTVSDENLAVEIKIEYGYACCRYNQKDPHGSEYLEGLNLLQSVVEPSDSGAICPESMTLKERKLYSKALILLAWCCKHGPYGDDPRHCDRALQMDPGNPYILAQCLSNHLQQTSIVNLIRRSILEAIATCRRHISSGLELPGAYFTIGRLHFAARDFEKSMLAYLEAIQYCRINSDQTHLELFNDELSFIKHSGYEGLFPGECSWIEKTLILGKAVAFKEPASIQAIRIYARKNLLLGNSVDLNNLETTMARAIKKPVLILAGGTFLSPPARILESEPLLKTALREFSGTIISGGTNKGVPGLIASVVGELNKNQEANITLRGYVPVDRTSVLSTTVHKIFTVVQTEEHGYGIGHPLQYWFDLIASDIEPADVTLVGISGGQIASMEYRMALALGARAAIIESSGRAAQEIFRDDCFNQNPDLINVPFDPYTLRALIISTETLRGKMDGDFAEHLDDAAQQIHEKYLQNMAPSDPSLQSWSKLDEGLKESNRHQAAYCVEVLSSRQYAIRKVKGHAVRPKFTKKDIEIMAEIEHGRWNAERLQKGWRYGPEKDVANKISPWLIPWEQLPPDIAGYDRNNISNYGDMLEKLGFEIYKVK